MKKGTISRIVVYGILACLISIGAGAWWLHLRIERAYADAFLLMDISEINLCGSILQLLDEEREDTVRKILEMRLEDTVFSAHSLLDYGGRLYPGAYPNMRKGLVQIAETARQQGKGDLAERVEGLIRAFEDS